MHSIEEAIAYLREYLRRGKELEDDRLDTLRAPMPQGLKDELNADLQRQLQDNRARVVKLLNDLTLFPPFHALHAAALPEFFKEAPFERSVFIMTKYPAEGSADPLDVRLGQIIQSVRDSVAACQHRPRVATDKDYHKDLLNNVELHLLGCFKGIAIVQDRHTKELNPNVALEWGWMLGLGRKVLYLVQKGFTQERADWKGLIKHEFDWDDPADSQMQIKTAVHAFLECSLKH